WPPHSPQKTWRRWLIPRLSIAIYFVACLVPALGFDKRTWSGFEALFMGSIGILTGQFAALANPLLFAAWPLLGLGRLGWGRLCCVAALALAATTFTVFSQDVPMDEAGVNHMRLQHLLPGFYLWITSMLVALIGSWWIPGKQRPEPQQPAS
ncbi:MAG TPA: hypothetical protein VK968_13510, partial [Roseimicrobium sp.]|nr:hypothetical protein [Roseimicrobium sp.]